MAKLILKVEKIVFLLTDKTKRLDRTFPSYSKCALK